MGELAGLLEDELDEALEEGAALEEGTEKVVLNEGGIAFKHAGFLDRSELAGVKVVVVDTLFPWWACVLGKTGAKVEGILPMLYFTLVWSGHLVFHHVWHQRDWYRSVDGCGGSVRRPLHVFGLQADSGVSLADPCWSTLCYLGQGALGFTLQVFHILVACESLLPWRRHQSARSSMCLVTCVS